MEAAGANIIEIGIPFSDPIADGPVIQEAFTAALTKKLKLSGIFEMVKSARGDRVDSAGGDGELQHRLPAGHRKIRGDDESRRV